MILILNFHFFLDQVGTYQIAVMAKAMNKPVYAVAESFKFLRIYPLNQKEVSNKHKVRALSGHFFACVNDLI